MDAVLTFKLDLDASGLVNWATAHGGPPLGLGQAIAPITRGVILGNATTGFLVSPWVPVAGVGGSELFYVIGQDLKGDPVTWQGALNSGIAGLNFSGPGSVALLTSPALMYGLAGSSTLQSSIEYGPQWLNASQLSDQNGQRLGVNTGLAFVSNGLMFLSPSMMQSARFSASSGNTFYIDTWGRISSDLSALDPYVAQNTAKLPWSLQALNQDLATQQAYDPRIGTTLPGAQAPIVVVADGTVAGQTITSYNQTARAAGSADPTQPSSISGLVEPGRPNSTLGDLHAEMDVIQQTADKNLTLGQDMSITVKG